MLRPYRSSVPRVDPTAYVDERAQVIGDVEIGQDSSVWMNVGKVRRSLTDEDVGSIRAYADRDVAYKENYRRAWCLVLRG